MEVAAEQRGQEGRVTEEGQWWGGRGVRIGGRVGGRSGESQRRVSRGGQGEEAWQACISGTCSKEQVRAFWLSGVSVILSLWGNVLGTWSQASPRSTLAKTSLAGALPSNQTWACLRQALGRKSRGGSLCSGGKNYLVLRFQSTRRAGGFFLLSESSVFLQTKQIESVGHGEGVNMEPTGL